MEIETYSIPKKFILLGTTWKVIMTKEFIKHEDLKALGRVNYKNKTIELYNGHREMQNTLFHELSHAYDYLTSCGRDKWSVNDGEMFASLQSLFWTQVFSQIKFKELKHLHKKKAKAGGTKCQKKKK